METRRLLPRLGVLYSIPIPLPAMPHSVSPNGSSDRKDEEMTDAPAPVSTENGAIRLEDMFDGDDDKEFPASSAQDAKKESSPAPASAE